MEMKRLNNKELNIKKIMIIFHILGFVEDSKL